MQQQNFAAADRAPCNADPALEPCRARLLALRAAWGVLAPSGLSERGLAIPASGKNVTDRITELTEAEGDCSPTDLEDLDRRLCEFESSMQQAASEVSVAQLRSTLPSFLAHGRPGLLDLLDVLIGSDPVEFETTTNRLGSIDYLITLLCTGGENAGGAIRHDPVNLTSRVQAVCQRAEEISGDRFADIEAEFFAASTMNDEDLREEFALRTLRSRKAELGSAFFVPRILRAVVTYNAALLDRVAEEILDSGDWGFPAQMLANGATHDRSTVSVFRSEPLQALARAVRDRVEEDHSGPTAGEPLSQIAWALDFDYLAPNELKALSGPHLATADDALGTAILIGLLCRSLAVLSVELQAVGLSPDDVSDHWTLELGLIFQEQINQSIAEDAYKIACALSELKNKFLSAPVADQFRQQKERVTPNAEVSANTKPAEPRQTSKDKEPTARDLVMDALEKSQDDRNSKQSGGPTGPAPWLRIAQVAIVIGLFVFAGSFFFGATRDLDRWSSDQLESVSPYLERGARNQAGQGPAFVGMIDKEWLALPAIEQDEAASLLVGRLRKLGLSQIMIYDRDDDLRIQAIGTQSTRVL